MLIGLGIQIDVGFVADGSLSLLSRDAKLFRRHGSNLFFDFVHKLDTVAVKWRAIYETNFRNEETYSLHSEIDKVLSYYGEPS